MTTTTTAAATTMITHHYLICIVIVTLVYHTADVEQEVVVYYCSDGRIGGVPSVGATAFKRIANIHLLSLHTHTHTPADRLTCGHWFMDM